MIYVVSQIYGLNKICLNQVPLSNMILSRVSGLFQMLFLEFHFKIKLYWSFRAEWAALHFLLSIFCCLGICLLREREKAIDLGFGKESTMGLIKDGSIIQFLLFSFENAVARGERK